MKSDRFVLYAVITVTIILYGLTLLLGYFRLSIPSDGGRLGLQTSDDVPDGVMITWTLDDKGLGLQRDDLVIAVDGQTITSWAEAIFDNQKADWRIGQTINYKVMRDGETLDIPITLGSYHIEQIFLKNIPALLLIIIVEIVAGWMLLQRPFERGVQILFLAVEAMITFTLCWFLYMDLAAFISTPALYVYYRLITSMIIMLMCAALLHFALLLPRLDTSYHLQPHIAWSIYIAPFIYYPMYLAIVYDDNALVWIHDWELGVWLFLIIYTIFAVAGISMEYRKLETPIARRRVEIIGVAYIVSASLVVAIGWLPVWTTGRPLLGWGMLSLFSIPVILSLGIAVIYYGLFDLKIVIQRTLIWGTLTSVVIIIYVGIVGILSSIFQSNSAFSLIATGAVAVIFQPLRHRLQKRVNYLIYGDRDTPYKVIMELTRKLEAAFIPQDALDTIVQTVGEALKLSYVAIELCQYGGLEYEIVAEYGRPDYVSVDERITFPLNEDDGRLIVAPHESGEELTSQDRRLIEGLVYQAEVTIETNRLTADLQRSRERIITAREEERRRLRRDLHDGLGPDLASLTLQIDAARNLLENDPSKADTLLVDLKTHIKDAVARIRTLAYELRPPALDELGLVAALRERAPQIDQSGTVTFTVESPTLPDLPAAIESAAYRIVSEAMINVVKHANATTCTVRFAVNSHLHIEIKDNGKGLPKDYKHGVGLQSMQERATELGGTCTVENASGGGTLVVVLLPLRQLKGKIK